MKPTHQKTPTLWGTPTRQISGGRDDRHGAGDTTLTVAHPGGDPWSNWADLYAIRLVSTVPIVLVTAPDPIDPPPTFPPAGNAVPRPESFTATVGAALTLQEALDHSRPGDAILVPSGVWASPEHVYLGSSRDFGGVTVWADLGAVLRGKTGIEAYGPTRGLTIAGLGKIEPDGKFLYSEGIMIDATRSGLDAKGPWIGPNGRIVIDGIEIGPQDLAYPIQRGGVTVWGGDLYQVTNCRIHDAAANAVHGFGTASSGISIGQTHRMAGATPSHGFRVLVEGNDIRRMIGRYDGDAADRNGINLDGFHGDAGAAFPDHIVGDVMIRRNIVTDMWGRGILSNRGGLTDSVVWIVDNIVTGEYGLHLGGSEPVCGIGAYGAGFCGDIRVSGNRVTGTDAVDSYLFNNVNGPGPGVTGIGNFGNRATFNASKTDTAPAGFLA